MRRPPPIAATRMGVFTLSEAAQSNWTSDAVRHAVGMGSLIRLRPGVFVVVEDAVGNDYDATRSRHAVDAIAAALANPRAAVSHSSAAVLHALPVWRLPDPACLTVPPHFVGDIENVHLHRARLPDAQLAIVHAVETTSVERTVVDIGREHGALSALVVADAALHQSRTDFTALREVVRSCAGWPGVRAARQAVSFADERAESPLESASRFRLHGEVPTPDLQPSIFDEHGRFLGRADMYWNHFGVVGEADGMQKYDGSKPPSLNEEKLRQENLENAGLIVVRWQSKDLTQLDDLVMRLRAAFARSCQPGRVRRWTARPMPRRYPEPADPYPPTPDPPLYTFEGAWE